MDLRRLAGLAGRQGQHVIAEEFAVYSTGRLAAIAALGTLNPNIAIQANSDFLIEKMTFAADLAGVAQTSGTRIIPNVSVQLQSSGSGNVLFNVQAPIDSLFGTGELPFILPTAYFLPASSNLQITLTSFEAAVTPRITLNFIGRKLYWAPIPMQPSRQ